MMEETSWVEVGACTLPTVERPLRLAEFDAVFADHLVEAAKESDTVAAFRFAGGEPVRAVLADLTARESQCCSFFGFDLASEPEEVRLTVRVPAAHVDVLEALVERARLVTTGRER